METNSAAVTTTAAVLPCVVKLSTSVASFSSLDSGNQTPAQVPVTNTPIRRPRPVLASAFSFDSGYEISPVSYFSFQYPGDSSSPIQQSQDTNNMVNVENNNNSDNNHNIMLMTQEDIEGVDDELTFIDHHFSPIEHPQLTTNQQLDNNNTSRRQQAFNLAMQRQQNRNNQIGNMIQDHLNNNDLHVDLFTLDDMEDDVFYEDDNYADQTNIGSAPIGQHWQIRRPSCTMAMPIYDNEEEENNEVQINNDASSLTRTTTSSSTSRCSSTPIPIPGAHNRRPSFLVDSEHGTLDSDMDMIDGNSMPIEYSLPDGRRMPYYHRMAPRLNPESEDDRQMTNYPQRSTTFGSRFQISFSMIMQNHERRRCYSPPPGSAFNNVRSHQLMPTCSSFLFRFGLMPFMASTMIGNHQQTNYDLGSLFYETRMLSPLPEIDEDNEMDLDDDDDEENDGRPGSPGLLFPMSPGSQEEDSQQSISDLLAGSSSSSMMNVDLVPANDRPNHCSPPSTPPNIATQCQCSCQCCLSNGFGLNHLNNINIIQTNGQQQKQPLPDVVMTSTPKKQSTNVMKFNENCRKYLLNHHNQQRTNGRNVLTSFHEVPYETSIQNDHQHHQHGGTAARRTMSVSLPINHEAIRAVARELRQISDEFQMLWVRRSASIKRKNSTTVADNDAAKPMMNTQPVVSSVSGLSENNERQEVQPDAVGLIRSMLGLFIVTANSTNHNHIRNHQRPARPPPPNRLPSARTVDNSTFYIGQLSSSISLSSLSSIDSDESINHEQTTN